MFRLLRLPALRDSLVTIALLAAIAALVSAPTQAVNGAKNGLDLCCNVIIPSLFPFFVLSSMAVDWGGLFRIFRKTGRAGTPHNLAHSSARSRAWS